MSNVNDAEGVELKADMSEVEDLEGEELDELPLLNIEGGPIQFSYKQLRKASNGFTSLLGKGGSGHVYKGELGGAQIAIKRLEGATYGDNKQFTAEVMTIGSVHHINLVRLHGYCASGHHRMLVYEFMPRGSLNRYIFADNQSTSSSKGQDDFLDWETRFKILLGTARAIQYLHEDCYPLIVHCDIKPGNILLGKEFNAKVSDFGLAQPMGGEAGHTASVTRRRGTPGYMAPEWLQSSFKKLTPMVDVYSFGIVVLEVISGRHAMDIEAELDSKSSLYNWANLQVMEKHAALEILDPRLRRQVTTNGTQHDISTLPSTSQVVNTGKGPAYASGGDIAIELDRAVFVLLWCIQNDPLKRPPMKKVVQWLEGIVRVEPPPNPF